MRLSSETLARLPASVAQPAYDRAAVNTGVVHLGVGAFHRAHQAVYLDDVLAGGDLNWGIVAASLRSPDTRDALAPQDGLYTLAIRSGAGDALRIVGSIKEVLVAPEDPQRLLAAMAEPAVRIVSLTVTEKGYCHDPATGELDESHPDIRHDLENPEAPRSAIGFLAQALWLRKEAGIAPFTALSCDNLPSNGKTLKRILTRFAHLRDEAFGLYVASHVACPSSMVDRIVPATTDADRALVRAGLGVEDAWPVMAEPFTQFVIEDDFPAGRPDLAAVGVELVKDVEPYEFMKLRLLNGSHSCIAYLGYLAGYQTVAQAMADPAIAAFVADLMEHEVTPTLPALPGFDLPAYKRALVERFRNPALKHRTWQIAMDGSQKLPQRLLGTIRDRLKAGASIDRLALGVAAWMRYVSGRDEKGESIDVRDPHAATLARITGEAGASPEALARALIAFSPVFGDDLPHEVHFTTAVEEALKALLTDGARQTLQKLPRA